MNSSRSWERNWSFSTSITRVSASCRMRCVIDSLAAANGRPPASNTAGKLRQSQSPEAWKTSNCACELAARSAWLGTPGLKNNRLLRVRSAGLEPRRKAAAEPVAGGLEDEQLRVRAGGEKRLAGDAGIEKQQVVAGQALALAVDLEIDVGALVLDHDLRRHRRVRRFARRGFDQLQPPETAVEDSDGA